MIQNNEITTRTWHNVKYARDRSAQNHVQYRHSMHQAFLTIRLLHTRLGEDAIVWIALYLLPIANDFHKSSAPSSSHWHT